MGVKSSQATNVMNPTTIHDSNVVINRANIRCNRFIQKFQLRKLYQRWAVHLFGKYKRDDVSKYPVLNDGEKELLLTELNEIENGFYQSLKELIEHCESEVENWSVDEKYRWKDFCRAIGTNEPVYQIAHPQIRNIIKNKNDISSNKSLILKVSPVIGYLIADDTIDKPDCFYNVLQSLGTRSDDIVTKLLSKRATQAATEPSTIALMLQHENIKTSGSCYGASYVRQRPKYAWDTEQQDVEVNTGCGM